jgi:hypothetical protein
MQIIDWPFFTIRLPHQLKKDHWSSRKHFFDNCPVLAMNKYTLWPQLKIFYFFHKKTKLKT